MSLTLEHPIVEMGDSANQVQAWRFSGIDDSNTNRGRVYVSLADSSGSLAVTVYSDYERTAEVASGTGALGSRITLTASGGSGLTGSVYALNATTANTAITLYVALASFTDLKERCDRLTELLLEAPAETEFEVIRLATLKNFLLKLQDVFPTPSLVGGPLRFPGSQSLVEQGSLGQVEQSAYFLWSLNEANDWELTGLQNPGDYREWAILDGLARIWARVMRSQDGSEAALSAYYERQAEKAWKLVRPHVDTDLDGDPDRPVRTRSVRFRRG